MLLVSQREEIKWFLLIVFESGFYGYDKINRICFVDGGFEGKELGLSIIGQF